MKKIMQQELEKKKPDSTEVGCLGVLVGTGNLFLGAWIITNFWKWFIHPLTSAVVEEISLLQAFGIILVLDLIHYSKNPVDENSFEDKVYLMLKFLFLLGVGSALNYLIVNGIPIKIG